MGGEGKALIRKKKSCLEEGMKVQMGKRESLNGIGETFLTKKRKKRLNEEEGTFQRGRTR